MSKTFIIERDILTQVWEKQKVIVEAEDLTKAINILRRTPKEEVYSKFSVVRETMLDTHTDLHSHINIDHCYELPTQTKLTI